ncbi:MAG: hypothetical protein IJZ54_08935 [Clostridia bacterium]|nr:hypothetical protein [Clostridia bacterium]
MSVKKWYEQYKKKKNKEESSVLNWYNSYKGAKTSKEDNDDIAPVFKADSDIKNNYHGSGGGSFGEGETKDKATWFQGGAFSDGYQFGDISKTILGTVTDVSENVTTAVVDATENLIDTGAYVVGAVGGTFNKDFRKNVGDFIGKEILQPTQTGEVITKFANPVGWINQLANGGKTEENSLLGDKADSLVQSAAHLVGSKALEKVHVPSWLTMGVNAFGSEIESAFQQDATYLEAGISGMVSAVAEVAFEKLSSGIKFKGGTVDEGFQKTLTKNISDRITRTILKYLTDLGGEGLEEVATEAVSAVGKKLTYLNEKEFNEIFSSEDAFDAFIGGVVMSGAAEGGNIVKSATNGTEITSGLTANEEKVVNKLYENALAEKQKDGTKLTKAERDKLWDSIVDDMSKGQLKIDDIESVLGGDTYKTYQETLKKEDAILKEFEQLGNKKTPTLADQSRYSELKSKVDEIKSSSKKAQLKSQLSQEVFGLVQSDKTGRLAESYKEVARRREVFTADLTKYKGKQKEAVQRAIDSGVLNNTYRSHELVNILSKIEADKGIVFNYADNAKLKESGFSVEGKTVNGFADKSTGAVTLNIQSAKSWQSVVGHEITHVLEGTEAYGELQKALYAYAESKGELENRRGAITELYKGMNADVDSELTADLVGDYLFTDKEFVTHLSTNRNLFQKIYDEIKYLYRVATGKEQKEIARVKKEFDKAWKELNIKPTESEQKNNTAENGGVSYKISEIPSKNEIGANYKAVANMESIVQLTGNEFAKGNVDLITQVTDYFDSIGGFVETPYGKVELTRSGVKSSIGHGIGRNKSIAFKAVPDVLAKGKIIDYQFNWKQRGYDKVVVAAPIKISDKEYFLAAIVNVEKERNSYYLHEVALQEKKDTSVFKTGTAKNGTPSTEISSIYSLLEKLLDVKDNSSVNIDEESDGVSFSLSQPVEETKELIAIHNLSADKLMKSLRLGGLPMPSIAIMKAQDGHNEFGDISLVFKKDTIDPKLNKANKVYGGDAWTPVYPTLEYKVNDKKLGEIYHRVRGVKGVEFFNPVHFHPDNIENDINRWGGIEGVVEHYMDDYSLKNFYLAEQGRDVKMISSERTKSLTEQEVEEYDFIINALGRDVILEHASGKNWMAEHGEAYKSAVVDYYSSILPNMTLEEIQSIVEQKKPLEHWRDVHKIVNYLENGATKTEIVEDREATIKEINRRVNDEDYAKWLKEFYDGTVLKSGIRRNNVDPYTASGNRKSFEATHYEENLENVIKAMKEQADVGNSAFFSGLGIWGAAAKSYKSIDEIKADESRLERLTDEEYSQLKTDFGSRLSEIAESIMDKRESNYFIALDNAMECIIEAVRDSKTKSGLLKNLKSYTHLNVTETTVSDLAELASDISNMPTTYFEAKPQRAVGFDEVGVFVLPKGTDNNLKQELLSRGYSVAEYDSNIEDDRRQVVNHLEEYKFSITDKSDDIAPEGDFNTPLNDLYYDDFAPIRSDIAPAKVETDTNVGGMKALSDDDIAPNLVKPKVTLSGDDIAPPVANNAITDAPVQTVEQMVAKNLELVEAELADNIELLKEVEDYYNEQITPLKNKYYSYKNQNTQWARDKLQRITELEMLKAKSVESLSAKISELEEKAKYMKTKAYSRALHKQAKMQEHAQWAEDLIGDTTTWVDKKLGLQYQTNTERRNLRDIVRDENGNKDIAKADAISDALHGQYNREEAAKKREQAQFVKKYADMKITKAESAYIQMLGELRYNPKTSLSKKDVDAFYENHKNKIDSQKVDKAISYARSDFDKLFSRLNEKLREQGMKEIPYRKGYFPHFTNPKQYVIEKLFNWKTQDNEIPTSIAGLTEAFRPVKKYQSFDKKRHTDKTDYNFLQGFDNYLDGALDWIYHLDTLQKRRAVENYLRYIHSDAGIKNRIKAIYANEEIDADEAQAQVDHILDEAKNPLNNFVQDFTTRTNILAGKKNSLDRAVEQSTNRHIYSVMTNVQNRLSANMVLANIRSAMTNFIPITQSWVQVSPLRSLQATKDTIANAIKDDGMIEKSTFLTNRLREVDRLYRTNWDKVLDTAGVMFDIVDNFSSQVIWRSKYNQNIAKGMTESEAIKNADQFAENVMAGRSKGNEPTLFNAKNPLVKAFTMFQLEVNNQYGYLFKDVPIDLKAETKHWKLNLAKGYTTAFVGAYVYNILMEMITGSDAALDPIGIIEDLLRDLFDKDEEKEPDEIAINLIDNVVEELPFVGGLFGGGRVPISSAMPYSDEYDEGLSGFISDVSEGEWGNIGKEMLNPLLNVVSPVGGGQLKKTVQGLRMFKTDEEHPIAGSYTDSGNLRFPVEDTPGNKIQAALFGQYANEHAREYFDNGYAPLKEKQIQEYMDVELPIADYWKYREGLKGLKTNAEKADYINSLDIEVWQKNLLMNNILDRKEDVDMSNYNDYGSWEEFDFAQKNPEKYAILQEQGISVSDYKENYEESAFIYTDDFSWAENNPEKYTLSKAVTDNVIQYKQYTSELSSIKADKDENGNSISGSRKEKVIDYINNLDADYGAKIILFRTQYPGDNTYNEEIVNYINNREDLSYEERVVIFEELGFEVSNESVYWD